MFLGNCLEKDIESEIKIPKHSKNVYNSNIDHAAHQVLQLESSKGSQIGECNI
jgi:hypothetical protein